jgi:hypothetical protein
MMLTLILMSDNNINSQIADELSDAIRATDEAYGIAREGWGENDPRTKAINSAWAEVETAFRVFQDYAK